VKERYGKMFDRIYEFIERPEIASIILDEKNIINRKTSNISNLENLSIIEERTGKEELGENISQDKKLSLSNTNPSHIEILPQADVDKYTNYLDNSTFEDVTTITKPLLENNLEKESLEGIVSKLDFNPENLTDARERTNRALVQRQGQSKFRSELLQAYGGQCAITDCDAEAAHIFPYLGTDTNHVRNGLLLRADIHTLFDLYLISIDPNTNKVIILSSLLNTCYKDLNGKPLKSPKDYARPSPEAIASHYKNFLLKQNK
jgi:HNH endonuclease